MAGCYDCKYFGCDTYHQTGFGTRHSYRCRKPYERTRMNYARNEEVTEIISSRHLDEPKKECDEMEEGKSEITITCL